MTSVATSLAELQDLLGELFRFDQADLDFGIYRIMNHKRDREDLDGSLSATHVPEGSSAANSLLSCFAPPGRQGFTLPCKATDDPRIFFGDSMKGALRRPD